MLFLAALLTGDEAGALVLSMADLEPIAGQLVCVTAPRFGDGAPSVSAYVVAEADPKRAEEIVKAKIAQDERVTGVWPLPAWAIAEFKLKPGQCTFWRDRP